MSDAKMAVGKPEMPRCGRGLSNGKWSLIFDTDRDGDEQYLIVDPLTHREGRIGQEMLDYFFGDTIEWR